MFDINIPGGITFYESEYVKPGPPQFSFFETEYCKVRRFTVNSYHFYLDWFRNML